MTDRSYILVVEDNEDLREVVVAVLEGAGFSVRSAGDGPAALDAIETSLPDLVVLDLFLPTMDGWKVMERIRGDRRTAGVPVIAMSAGQVTPPPGVVAFVRKPFDVLEFVTLVRRFARPG